MKFKFKSLTVATLSLSLVINSSGIIRAAAPDSSEMGTSLTTIKVSDEGINLNYTGEKQNLINISDYYKGDGIVWYKIGENGTWSTEVPTEIDVGKYDVYYYIVGDPNYNNYNMDVTINATKDFTDAISYYNSAKEAVAKFTTSSTGDEVQAVITLVDSAIQKLEQFDGDGSSFASGNVAVGNKINMAKIAIGGVISRLQTTKTNLETFKAKVEKTSEDLYNVSETFDNGTDERIQNALSKILEVIDAENTRVATSPSHVVVNIIAKDNENPSSEDQSSDSSAAPSADENGDSSAAPSSGNSSSSDQTTNVPMTINYSVSEDGTTSTVIDRNGIVWLREESDGTGAWYGIDNSDGAFELGSTFHVKWLKKGDEEYEKYFNQLDAEYKKKAETNNIEIFLVGVTKPDGKTEYKNFMRDDKWYNGGGVGLYVQLGDDWDASDINALFVSESSDTPVTVQYGTASKFMSLYDGILFPEVSSKYARLTLTHFSPYAVVGAKKSSSSSSDLSSYYKALSTKTGEDYSNVLYLLSMSSISLIYALILRKKKLLG